MNVIPVISKETISEFLNFPQRLFKEDKNYIRPLDQDIENVFDSKKNKFFKAGSCERFLFKNEANETVGKIAVFVNKKYRQEQPTGGIGFFDCIDDQIRPTLYLILQKTGCKKKEWKRWMGPLISANAINSGDF